MKKFLTSLFLATSLFTNSIAFAATPAYTKEEVGALVQMMNSKKFTFKDALNEYSKTDERRAKQIEDYFSTRKTDYNLPKFSAEDSKLVITFEKEKYFVTLFHNGDITLTSGKKSVTINSAMDFNLIEKELATAFPEHHVSLMNFIVSDAQAFIGQAVGMIVLAVAAIIIGDKIMQNKPIEAVQKAEEVCSKIKDASSAEIDLASLKDVYNEISPISVTCKVGQNDLWLKDSCAKLPKIKKCIKDKISEMDKGFVSTSKEYKKYDVLSDSYKVFSAHAK